MATTNGTHTTPDLSSSTTSKRKREDDDDTSSLLQAARTGRFQQTQRDILELLQPYTTYLHHDFDDATEQPSHKKARLAQASATTNIAAKLANAAYPSLSVLAADAKRVSTIATAALRQKAAEREAARLSVDDLKGIQRADAFAKYVSEVVEKEMRYESVRGVVKKESAPLTNGHAIKQEPGTTTADKKLGTILTLFGNAPTPKQLFSSMQHPPHASSTLSSLPIEELPLPTGLTATTLLPLVLPPANKATAPTLGTAFPPPYSLPPLLAPSKSHSKRLGITRDTELKWEHKDPIARTSSSASRKGGYTVQTLTSGQWLGYGGNDKRKAKLTEAEEEDALFKRAYSSFAPSRDDKCAVVPTEVVDEIWWAKVGEQRFVERFAAYDAGLIDPQLLEQPAPPATAGSSTEEEEGFEAAILALDSLADTSSESTQLNPSKTDISAVLRDISALLETLASHQRLRASQPPTSLTSTRTPLSPAPILSSRPSGPDTPSPDELATHAALLRELSYLLLQLPPSALAKSPSHPTSLTLRTLLRFTRPDIKGTLDDDLVARTAKYNALATAAGIASLARSSATPTSSSQHYSSSSVRVPAIGQAAQTRYAQPPATGYGSGIRRTPASSSASANRSAGSFARPAQSYSNNPAPASTSGGVGGYSAARAAGAGVVAGYGSNSSNNYSSSSSSYPQQNSTAHYGTPSSQQQQTPARASSAVYPPSSSQPLQQYQQRALQAQQQAAYQSQQQLQQQGGYAQGSPAGYAARTASPASAVGTKVGGGGGYGQPGVYAAPGGYAGSGRSTPVQGAGLAKTPTTTTVPAPVQGVMRTGI